MKKKTAVEWLYSHLFPKQLDGFSPEEWDKIDKAFEQAKGCEKAQHQISFDKGYDRRNYIHDFEYGGVEYWEEEPKEFIDYYTETYGK
jgi:hypothetical protein